ncbi:MAG: PUA domain-containing protein [Nitrososphaerota archaeon]
MRFHRLSKSDLRALRERLRSQGLELECRTGAVMEADERKVLVLDGFVLFEHRGLLLPIASEKVNGPLLSRYPAVYVDLGAVPHVLNGAAVMRPGIVRIEGTFSRGDVVVVREEKGSQAIAIGEALLSSGEALSASKGRVISNVQRHGDRYHELGMKALELLRSTS